MKLLSLRDQPSTTQKLLATTLIASALALAACSKKEEAAAPATAPAAGSTAGKSAAQVAVDAAKPLCQGGKTITIQNLITRYMKEGHRSLDYRFYAGGRHEILNESEKDRVQRDIGHWLTQTLDH
jgi:alpha-beta hydrolase superfamily lysophospholipase